MKIVIDIPEEQIKKSLEESKNIHEDEGEKGSVHIMMLYTNGRLDFVDVSRKKDFYSCEYKILPKGHGRLIDADELKRHKYHDNNRFENAVAVAQVDWADTIIEADKAESEDEK